MRRVGLLTVLLWATCPSHSEVLTPPYFNLAERRRVTATATCGEGVEEPELFCKLIGANSELLNQQDNLLIQGQVSYFILFYFVDYNTLFCYYCS